MVDDVIRVGEKEISAAAIAAEAQNHPAASAEEAWAMAAEALVIRQLLLDEADRLGIASSNMTDAEGRTLTSDDARIEALLEQEVKTPNADPETALRFYETHKQRFASAPMVEAEHILFAASPDDQSAYNLAMEDARIAITSIQAKPDSFADLARKMSACPSKEMGGNLGQIGPGQTVPPFEKALFALDAGQLCDEPVPTKFGVHVIRAGRKVDGQQLPFEAVQSKISDYLEEASWRRAVSQYLAILASQTSVEGITLQTADGPLVQ